jgi:hypothetical protein
MRSRASFTIGWTVLDGLLRTGESTLLNKYESIYVYWVTESEGAGDCRSAQPIGKTTYREHRETLQNCRWLLSSVVQIRLPASVLRDNKNIGPSVRAWFFDVRREPPPHWHRLRFDRASSWKTMNGK